MKKGLLFQVTDDPPLPPQHRFIQRTSAKPLISEVAQLAATVLNFSLGQKLSVTRYRKLGRIEFDQKVGQTRNHGSFQFDEIVQDIREHRTLNMERFNLPLYQSFLDEGSAFSNGDGPILTPDRAQFVKLALELTLGPTFPIKPCIDREGVAYSSFQRVIQASIVKLHAKLVDECQKVFDLDDPSWLQNLRMLLNECYTIVDMTLHQLYFKAQYAPKPGWTFDPHLLGDRHGRRIMDKFQWIGRVTRKPLDNAEEEKKHFQMLKDIRNHVNHFDPPCVAFSIEDVVDWLNRVPGIGRLLWKIRHKMDEPPSKGVVEIITLPFVAFVPKQPNMPRVPQGNDVGYRSSTWPGQ